MEEIYFSHLTAGTCATRSRRSPQGSTHCSLDCLRQCITSAKELPSTWLPLKSTDWFLHTYMFLKNKVSINFCAFLCYKTKSQWSFWKWRCRTSSFLIIASLWPITLLCLKQFYSLAPVILLIVISKKDSWFHLWVLN